MSQLSRYALLGLPLAFLGLPLYMYLPKFYADSYGLGLAELGAVLLLLRVGDLVADPIIGYYSDRTQTYRTSIIRWASFGLALSYALLFIPPLEGVAPLHWFAIGTGLTYLFYSTVTVNFYAVGLGVTGNPVNVSTARERCVLIGTLLAALLPAFLMRHAAPETALQINAVLLCALLLVAVWVMPKLLAPPTMQVTLDSLAQLWRSSTRLRFLFVIFFVNALPVAITSTLFLFFVDDVLGREADSGYYLALYFLFAIIGTPLWERAALRWGQVRALLVGLVLAIITFIGATFLSADTADWFYLVCAMSGLALGADMIILPALLATALRHQTQAGGTAFAVWQALSKLSLAVAAGVALPTLSMLGYDSAAPIPQGVTALQFAYAGLPCLIKLGVVALLLWQHWQERKQK